MNTIGVSPAFIISEYGEDFTIDNYSSAVPLIKGLGFKAIQLEIYSKERIREWESGRELLARRITDEGLYISQFVAHLLMVSFTGRRIDKDEVIETFKRVLGLAEKFLMERVITVPIGTLDKNSNLTPESIEYKDLKEQMEETVLMICETAKLSDFKVALEVLPGSLVGGVRGFGNLLEKLKADNLGINLDTGHANVTEKNVETLPLVLKNRIFGTHLSDNNGIDNLSLRPGKGNIKWDVFLSSLRNAGYTGSLDIEIHCRTDEVEIEYSSAYSYIEKLFGKEGRYGKQQ